MESYLERWKDRCLYSSICSEYHHLNGECQCAIDQKNCVLYLMFKNRIIKLPENKLEQITKPDKEPDFGGLDGTCYLG
jgi:hypothetical protein